MHDHGCLRQLASWLVMISDDQLDSQSLGFLRLLDAANAAVDRNDDAHTGCGSLAKGFAIQSVSCFEAMGVMVSRLAAQLLQGLAKDDRAGQAIDVVIAVHRDSAARRNGSMNPVRRFGYAGQ